MKHHKKLTANSIKFNQKAKMGDLTAVQQKAKKVVVKIN